jgi:hypothetical protein
LRLGNVIVSRRVGGGMINCVRSEANSDGLIVTALFCVHDVCQNFLVGRRGLASQRQGTRIERAPGVSFGVSCS